jgi:aspartate/methionine/tyrosine aminotransferase
MSRLKTFHNFWDIINELSRDNAKALKDFGMGMPPTETFPLPSSFLQDLSIALEEGDFSLYMPARGPLKCLENICDFENNRLSRDCHRYSVDSFSLNCGAINAFSTICDHLLSKGEAVAFPAHSYFSLSALTEERYLPQPFNFHSSNFNLELFKGAINDQTKMVWLCQPNNPTGLYVNKENLHAIIEFLDNNKIWLVLDESCDTFQRESENWIPSNINSRNVIRIKSFAKDVNIAGIRLGYTVADPGIISSLSSVTPILHGNPSTLAIRAITNHFEELNNGANTGYYKELQNNHRKILNACDVFYAAIQESDIANEVIVPEACYYIFLKLRTNKSSEKFFMDLIHNTGNIIVPGTVFGYPNNECWVRVCFARELESLIQLIGDMKSQL